MRAVLRRFAFLFVALLMITGLPLPAAAQPARPSDTQFDPPWGLDRIDQRTGRNQKYFYSMSAVRV